ncbi:uncharacterized protein [Brachyistius frenatus]|uniref:uncharacterized protein n=1 Tax=Brachyistius frenatus TaxID=100188 RepID=UPI0037E883F5
MIGRLSALILLCTLCLTQTQKVPQQVSLTVAELGDTFTVTCTVIEDGTSLFYWYRLYFGYMVQTVAMGIFAKLNLAEQFDNPRFDVTKVGKMHSLTIRNISKEDEGTYFCQAGSAYKLAFINGTFLAVKDRKNVQKSVYVKQSPDVESVWLGEPVTLQCSFLSKNQENTDQCPGACSVHWFKARFQSLPGIIYTDNISSYEQKERRCVYRLSKTIRDSSDAGTYYCAVDTCGEILFGEGTKVEIRQELFLVIVLGTLLTCSVLLNTALILTRKQKPGCKYGKGEVTASNHAERDRSADNQPRNADGEAEERNYAALDFPSRKAIRHKNKRDLPEECIYSDTREHQ